MKIIEKNRFKKRKFSTFLSEYDIGQRDVFLCLAVNLLELDDLKAVLKEANESTKGMDLNVKSDYMKDALNGCTKKRNIELKLRR